MEVNKQELEKSAIYRLIKVVYMISLLFTYGFEFLAFRHALLNALEENLWWVLFLMIFCPYVLLNLTRETVLYVIFGKSFSWDDFKRII